MKKSILAILIGLCLPLAAQTPYSGIPKAGAMYVSSNGTFQGPWDPIMFAAGTVSYGGIPQSIGLYYSSDGTGNKGTWYPCTLNVCFGTLPPTVAGTCTATNRGQLQYTAGGAGVKDIVQVCAKDATDAYAWRAIY